MNLSKKQHFWFITTLLIGTFTMSISQSSLSTAYPTFMHYFNLPASTISWLTTGFMLIMSVVMPLSPWMLNNLSFKKMYLSLLTIFIIGTFIIIFSKTFILMMIGRLMEGFAVGVLFPTYQSVILQVTPLEERGTTMGTVGLVMGSALAVGPILSGVILQIFNWQSIFIFFNILLILVALLASKTIVNPIITKKSNLDVISVIFSMGIIGLLYFINEIAKQGFTSFLIIVLLVSIVMLGLFIRRQFKLSEPLLHLEIMKTINFDLGVALTALSYMSLITVTIVMPLYFQQILNLSPFWSGLALVPAAALLSWLNRRSGRLADRIGFKPVVLIGILIFIVGWSLMILNVMAQNLLLAILATMVVEAGNAFVMMPATTLAANSLPDPLIPHGSSIIATIRQVLGSTAVVIATVILGKNNFIGVFIFFLLLELLALVFAFKIKEHHPSNG